MPFFKDSSTNNFAFENEVLDIKTILGNVYLYSETKNLNRAVSRFHELFKNKNDALLYATKQYTEYIQDKQTYFVKNESTKRIVS